MRLLATVLVSGLFAPLFVGGCKNKEPYEKASSLLVDRLTTLGAASQALLAASEDLEPAVLKFATAQLYRCADAATALGEDSPARPIADECRSLQTTCSDKAKCVESLAAIDKIIVRVSGEAVKNGLTRDAIPTAAVAAERPKAKALIDGVRSLSEPRPKIAKAKAAWSDPSATEETLTAVCQAVTEEKIASSKTPIPEGLDKTLIDASLSLPYLEWHRRCNAKSMVSTTELLIQTSKGLPKSAASKSYCTNLSLFDSMAPASYASRVKAIEAQCK